MFLSLGLGFALPYLVLAAAPGLAGRLPRPGAWMELLRQALAFPMYAAALWLAWVVAQEAGADGVLVAGGGCLLLALAAWLAGLPGSRRTGRVAALACLVAAACLLPGLRSAAAPRTPGRRPCL